MTVFLIFFPLLVSLLIFLVKPAQAKTIAFAASLVELAATLYAITQFTKNETVQFVFDVTWIRALGMNFAVGMDGISIVLVLLTSVLVPGIILSVRSNFARPHTFYGLVLMMQMALVGVFVALDGLLFYLFWEVALIPIYFICLIWGGEDRGRITLKFFIYTLAGSLFMLVGLVYLYLATPGDHTFAMNALYEAGRSLSQKNKDLYSG